MPTGAAANSGIFSSDASLYAERHLALILQCVVNPVGNIRISQVTFNPVVIV